MMNGHFRNSYLAFIYLFLYLPIIVVIGFSFNNSAHSLIWHGFTWHWYHKLFHDANLGIIAFHSLILGIIAATCATSLGMIAAISFFRFQFFGKKFFYFLIFALIVLPDLVIGISLLLLYSLVQFPLGFWSLLFAHIILCLPFTTVTILARLQALDKHIIEAGRDLGASEFRLYWDVLVPLLLPSLVVSWLLSFTLSLDDIVISYFVSGPSFQILPLEIFSLVKLGANPEINALCSIILLFTLGIVVSSQLIIRRKQ